MLTFMALFTLAQSVGPVSTREARVPTEGAELAITLAWPSEPGPRPAVLILPGSGPATRDQMESFREPFLNAGFAVLTFDKRGSGASSGSWLNASLEDLAGDGRALLKWLRGRPEVDAERVGLVGVSQGGWLAPLVAAEDSGISFLVTLTGGAVRPRVIEAFDYERRLRHAGIEGADLAAARKAVGTYLDYLEGSAPRSEVLSLLDAGQDRAWPKALGLARVLPDDNQRPAWSWVSTFDPLPSLRRLRIPVLALIGGRDRDPSLEVTEWQKGLAENGNPLTEIRVVPNAGHVLTVGDSHREGSFNRPALNAMARWAAASIAPTK